VTNIDGIQIGNGREGQVTRQIREMYTKIVSGEVNEYLHWLTPVWQS
jgi:branched-chain amino acid aminotransferase